MKTFREILNNMVGWITTSNSKITNFYVGSVIRTLLEAVAIEIESIYFQMQRGFKFAIENAIYHSFNFYKNPAIASRGEVLVIFKAPLPQKLIIPKGYELSTTPIGGVAVYFKVLEDVQAPYGAESIKVLVECNSTGVVGNVPAYSIRRATVTLSMIQEIYNPEPFITGQPEESKEDRKKRFTRYIDTLSRGTLGAIQYGCLRVQGVTGAYADESIGEVVVYVHDAAGNLSDELKEQIRISLIEYRSAGIPVNILPVTKRSVDMTIEVQLNPGFDPARYREVVENSVTSFLNYYTVSKSLIKAEVIRYIMSIDENAILNIQVSLPGDIKVSNQELIRAGAINVTIVAEV